MVKRIFDISIPVVNDGLVYPGNPAISIEQQQSITKGAGANVSRISFGSHTATHVDAARHFIDHGRTVDQIGLGRLVGRAILISVDSSLMSIGRRDLEQHQLMGHTRVLIRSRNSGFLLDREFHPDYTYLAPDAAEYLLSLGVDFVGVDYLSIEQFHSGHHRTHRTLLERDVVIAEGLLLSEPPDGEYELICLPLKLAGVDGAPARAILIER
ncbi:MAG TPA: cyclase family protein [Gemmatimonadaceae bacterium]|nr:cyclase family protein [Gemmatimonadaceae bacterium]